jgi:hypothetical protein
MKGLNYHKEMLEDSLAMVLSIDIYILKKILLQHHLIKTCATSKR